MLSQLQRQLLRLRENRAFEMFVVTVIIISALEIGAKTYDLPPIAHTLTHFLDIFITVFFLFEIVVRFLAEENKKQFFRSGWNVFDTLVVVVSLIPIQDSEMALLARLVRVFRVLRMISIIPELRILINSLLKALPKLGYVVLLLFIIFYIYAAVGSFLFANINPNLWSNIAISMLTLFRIMTFEDWTDIQYETMEVYPFSWMYYMSFIFFTAFAFLNMVIGIVVNVMEEEHAKAREEHAKAREEHAKAREEQADLNPNPKPNPEPTMQQLQQEIRELKGLVLAIQRKDAGDKGNDDEGGALPRDS